MELYTKQRYSTENLSPNLTYVIPQALYEEYENEPVKWGFTDTSGHMSLGELTYIRTYSRLKKDGSKERWAETVARCVSGLVSLYHDSLVKASRTVDEDRLDDLAERLFDAIFRMRILPPGRGLANLGTALAHGDEREGPNSAVLNNCAVIDTDISIDGNDRLESIALAMHMLFMGIGVGATLNGAYEIPVYEPVGSPFTFVVADTRESWVDSVQVLLDSYTVQGSRPVEFDYSMIRPAGEPIVRFGGIASGSAPLRSLHRNMREVLTRRATSDEGIKLGTEDLADLINLLGVCVVSGGVRRSAELLLGDSDDKLFMELKNPEFFPARNSYDPSTPGWAFASNNSIKVHNNEIPEGAIEGALLKGEPGFVNMDRLHEGRFDEAFYPEDFPVAVNPCAEAQLEHAELCCLFEIVLPRQRSIEDFENNCRLAFLSAKLVQNLPTPWEATNEVVARNRRVGVSVTGVTDSLDSVKDKQGFWNILSHGYEIIRRYDLALSNKLDLPESVRKTVVKPSGSVSLLAGVSPGAHWSVGGPSYFRAIRFSSNDPIVAELVAAGYRVEEDLVAPSTHVAYFPIVTDVKRSDLDVSLSEKLDVAVNLQKYWADQAVSLTASLDPSKWNEETLKAITEEYLPNLKCISYLPSLGGEPYPQAPYTPAKKSELKAQLEPIDKASLYGNGKDAKVEKFCDTESCSI